MSRGRWEVEMITPNIYTFSLKHCQSIWKPSFTSIANCLITVSWLCVGSKGEKDPSLTHHIVSESEPNNLPVCDSLSWLAERSMMVWFLCVDSKTGTNRSKLLFDGGFFFCVFFDLHTSRTGQWLAIGMFKKDLNCKEGDMYLEAAFC